MNKFDDRMNYAFNRYGEQYWNIYRVVRFCLNRKVFFSFFQIPTKGFFTSILFKKNSAQCLFVICWLSVEELWIVKNTFKSILFLDYNNTVLLRRFCIVCCAKSVFRYSYIITILLSLLLFSYLSSKHTITHQ